ncbi:DNA polymerase IV [Pedobacter sp. SD-b]|uniref:DNA polymerase IV n=1 Tax=Pedobacter segetis TaxID=2793069 RepID=A0ABS1BHZ1_9SPHI|nr:DNA polymerase IV [Pedobacter segetis]MBK0382480.1 DNA polymerase IV [Pedobacter segetis]
MIDAAEDKPNRKIIHIDMDAFYASVEQRDFPEFRGKALAVGGSPDGRGVVATASYEARKFGVKSAMSSKTALQLCPHLLFTKPRFEAYKEVSLKIREIFNRYTDLIEPLSLDEAYLDVSDDKMGIGSAIDIAKAIKEAIKKELNLTASAGVSVNKFIAKIASDMNKPDGLTFIGPSKIIPFIEALPVEKFFGVGKVTALKMKNLGLFYGSDLKKLSENEMQKHFGKTGRFFYQIVRGFDDRPVNANRISKSIGAEDTFENDIDNLIVLKKELEKLSSIVYDRLTSKNKEGKTLTLKVKFNDFSQITRSHTFLNYITDKKTIFETAVELLEKLDLEEKKVRLLGVTLSNFYNEENDIITFRQLNLFEDLDI